ncbi:MAG TPA: DoxX family protein [Caulobacteraceae bacterium]|jgi:putative oxidoreductase|nr:DoxX family protein [Caulobacteraceae bacterium]
MFNFDLSNGYVLLRIVCGAFIIPHAIGKITAQNAVTGFFTAAGFRPVKLWVYSAMAIEWILALAMILGVYTRYTAALTGVFMLVATAANHRVCKGKWLWNLGGSEYPFFWALCCFIVALHPS